MALPNRVEAQALLEEHVKDEYQKYHVKMVATSMEGYAKVYNEDPDLWYITGLLHDIDFEEHPDIHPKQSLEWFKDWGYPEELIHAVEAHAYAYRKLNPISYGEMKVSSIKKRLAEKTFAANIERETIYRGCELLDVSIDEHIANLIKFFSTLIN